MRIREYDSVLTLKKFVNERARKEYKGGGAKGGMNMVIYSFLADISHSY